MSSAMQSFSLIRRPAIAPILIAVLTAACMAIGNGASAGETSASRVDAASAHFTPRAVLASIGRRVMIPTYNAFNGSAQNLVASVRRYCADVKNNFNTASPLVARQAWRAAMSRWQIAEMFQFGPVAMNDGEIRNNIYSWPIENTCSVDQNVINFENNRNPDGTSPFNINAATIDSRGLDALAYLLFARSKNHSCPVQVTVTRNWNARPLQAREAARCDYATAVAGNIRVNAQVLVNAWDPNRGNYLRRLTSAGSPGSDFASVQEALNVITDAIFYIEEEVKEMKLGEPLGKFNNICGPGEICPEALEGLADRTSNGSLDAVIYNSQFAKAMLRANVAAFQLGFHGGPPSSSTAAGFYDYLIALGQRAFADRMRRQIQALINSIDGINGPLDQALVSDFQTVDNVYEVSLQALSISLRNQFLSILGLEPPDSSASDTD
jgi:uncharacterized protein